jgi:ATPase subunit of ABC transporter with duplicated ATPase domains
MLHARGISRAFGGQTVLDDVSISLDGRDRVGVVGPNGVGKTTLLRVLAGLEAPDAGTVERAPRQLTVGYLPQEPDAVAGETLLEYLARRTGVATASGDLDRCTAELSEDPASHEAYADALDRFMVLGGDDLEARAASTIAAVGLGRIGAGPDAAGGAERFAQRVASLSGGEAARAALAAILLSRVDVLLLDEPTNNLDFAGLDLLEQFVDAFAGAVLVVSHDRDFLDRSVERIVELDGHTHRARDFAGAWTAYTAARDLARSQQSRAHGQAQAERERLVERQRTQKQWTERGVKRAKTSGEPDKNIRASHRERSEKQAGKVKATERRLARLPTVDKPWEGWRLELSLAATGRSGDVVVRLDQAVVQRSGSGAGLGPGAGAGAGSSDGSAGFRLGPMDLEVTWQDRVAILGPNGSGKSTLLAALLGQVPLASGRRWIGPGVRIGEMDQARDRFGGDPSVLATFQALTDLPLSESRSLLAKFGLGPDHLVRAGRDLSPGERSRAQLGALMATGVNCLVLDEPTNHLDIEAIEQLESALSLFDGTLLLVSHDRRFLDTVDLTRTIEL